MGKSFKQGEKRLLVEDTLDLLGVPEEEEGDKEIRDELRKELNRMTNYGLRILRYHLREKNWREEGLRQALEKGTGQ